MHKFGDVILTEVFYHDKNSKKLRPALILYQEEGNVIIAGITSNKSRPGIELTKKEGAIKESIIRTNYIFTISKSMIRKKLFSISNNKKEIVKNEIIKRMS